MVLLIGLIIVLFFVGLPVMMIVSLARLGYLRKDLSDLKRTLDFKRMLEEKKDEKRKMKNEEVEKTVEYRVPDVAVTTLVPKVVEEGHEKIRDDRHEDTAEAAVRDDRREDTVEAIETIDDNQRTVIAEHQPVTAMEMFWMKVEDWLAVRGEFAPKGVTHEFAFATRWLVRVGAVLLVGAIAYFLMLAIDKGWIGPVQRVYGMMVWGVAGTAFGTWLKLKSERYAILGEVIAALGLVAAYLSVGLGHRYFNPPVIASGSVAFAGLFLATIAAGFFSVRLRSLMIACLALVGGFLVPTICSFTSHDVQLHGYLFVLSLGACAVTFLRSWTAYGFAAITVAALFSHVKCDMYADGVWPVAYLFHTLEFALFFATTVRGSVQGDDTARTLCWSAATLAGTFCLCKTSTILFTNCVWHGTLSLHHFGWAVAFAVLAVLSRRRNWGGTPVMIVFSCVSAAFALGTACIKWWYLNDVTVIFLFCVFAALLVDLGVRYREKSLQVLSLIAVSVLSLIGFGYFVFTCEVDGMGYARDLVDRIQFLWPVPLLVAFVGWRLGAPKLWLERIRRPAFATAAGMAFFVLTVESHLFGREFLPFLRGGFVTTMWAIVASALLAAGILRRVKFVRLWGLGLLAVSVAKLLLFDTTSLATPGRVGVFAAVGVLLIAGAFLYLRFKPLFEAAGAEASQSEMEGNCE